MPEINHQFDLWRKPFHCIVVYANPLPKERSTVALFDSQREMRDAVESIMDDHRTLPEHLFRRIAYIYLCQTVGSGNTKRVETIDTYYPS